MGTLGALATGAFLGLAGEGLGLGALTAFGAAVVSLATVLGAVVLGARLVLDDASSSVSNVFLALDLAAGIDLAFPVSLTVASFVGFPTF